MLFENYTVHRLFVDGNWYEISFPLVYVRITFIHYYLPKIPIEKALRLQHSIAFIKNRGEKTTRFSAGYRVHSSCYLRRDSEKFVWIIVTNQRYFLCGSRVLQYFIVFRYYSAVPAQAEHRFQRLSGRRRRLRLTWISGWWIRSRWGYRNFSPVRVICCVCCHNCRCAYLCSAWRSRKPAVKCPAAASGNR